MKRITLLFAMLSVVALRAANPKEEVVERTQKIIYQEATSRYMEPSQCMMTSPLIADIKVLSKRITYTETEAYEHFDVTKDIVDLIPNFKKIALCHAAQANNADMIIGATVDVQTNANNRIEITISGYPAMYANFRNATKADLDLVENGNKVMFLGDAEVVLGEAKDKTVLEETKKRVIK